MKGTRLFSSNRNLKVLMLGMVALTATGLALVGYAARTLRSLDLNTVNARFSVRGAEKPPSNVVVVAIDSRVHSGRSTSSGRFPERSRPGCSIASTPVILPRWPSTSCSPSRASSARRMTWRC